MRFASKLILAACCSAAFTACPVDDRTLEPIQPIGIGGVLSNGGVMSSGGVSGNTGGGDAGQGDGGDAGSSMGGSPAQGGSSMQGGAAGMAARGGSAGAPVGRCPDLDVNGELDCEESLVTNATFDASVLPWVSENPNLVADWSDADAHDKMDSGSMRLENRSNMGSSTAGARQCVPVKGGTAYNFAVEAMVPEEAETAQAGIYVIAYEQPGCTMLADDPKASNFIASGTGWRVASLPSYLMPAHAKSVMIRLVCIKPSASQPGIVFYDNVLMNED